MEKEPAISEPTDAGARGLRLFAWLALTGAFLILLFARGFCDPDEGRYAEIPREMVAAGDWRAMRMLGYRYYEKPPLAYWLTAPAIALCGARDWAARIPLAVSALLLFAMFSRVLRARWPEPARKMALAVTASTLGIALGTCLLITDAFLLLWFSLTGLCLFLAFPPKRDEHAAEVNGLWLLAAAGAAYLGFLTKGAVALVLPAAMLTLWLAWERRLRALLHPVVFGAAWFLAALIVPTLLWIERHNPGFIRQFIVDEHLGRFLGTRKLQLHAEPFWFYAKVLPALLLPWTLFAFRAGRRMIAVRAWRADPLLRFFLVWIATVLVFFSISTGKLMSYILPALPPLCLLIGRWGVADPTTAEAADRRLWQLGLVGMWMMGATLALAWLTAYFQWWPRNVYPVPGFSLIALLPLGFAAFWAWSGRRRHAPRHGAGDGAASPYTPQVLAAGLLLTAALLLSPLTGKDFNVRFHQNYAPVYRALAAHLGPDDRVVVCWTYRPSLAFYLQRLYAPFQVMNELEYGMRLEPARPTDLRTREALVQWVAEAPGRVFAVLEPSDLTSRFATLEIPWRATDLPRDPETLVVELLPNPE